ncbi:hypothetical protein [Dongia sedimenti]|uniref:DUF3137 domain-containing protein n=1 Tax=Dongia sedimenti TaxID=3064282 RepID=A0ABU0YTH8_9PROT|nr:hypothetical protein [Rhodospirillaceae bacterium R-7]
MLIAVLVLVCIGTAWAAIRILSPFGKSPLRVALKLLLVAAIAYPVVEYTIVLSAYRTIAVTLGGGVVYEKREPIASKMIVGIRNVCDVECYGAIVDDRYAEVEIQISGAGIQTDRGTIPYFITSPGLYGFKVASDSDPRCAPYNEWVSALGARDLKQFGQAEGMSQVLWLEEDKRCLIAEQHDRIRSAVAQVTATTLRGSLFGTVREFRSLLLDITHPRMGVIILAENRTFQLVPSWPVSEFIANLGNGVFEANQPLRELTEAAPAQQ